MAEFLCSTRRKLFARKSHLGWKNAFIEPFKQLPTAISVNRVDLRKVNMGVYESGQEKGITVIDNFDWCYTSLSDRRSICKPSTPLDDSVVINKQRTVRNLP